MKMKPYHLLESVLEDAQKMNYNEANHDKILGRAEMIAKKIFGENTGYINKLESISFLPKTVISGMDQSIYTSSFDRGKKQLINLLQVMQEDVSLSGMRDAPNSEATKNKGQKSPNIFLVHGHNEEMKQSTARFLEKFDLKPIILHEQPNRGRTIIEKFTDYANVDFAIILLSADDFAFEKTQNVESGKLRARQNVILELGFFLGKIGRENVIVLHEQVENFEIPSDYQGVLYEPYDSRGNWKLSIAKELKESGYEINGDVLLE